MLDLRDLPRRAGSMIERTRTVPAPSALGIPGVVEVPEGSDIELELRLESVVEGVLVTASAQVRATGECSRCLQPLAMRRRVNITELFLHPENDRRGKHLPGPTLDEHGDPVPQVVDDLIDLQPTLRDEVVLALPAAPLCRPDCQGLCPDCGERWETLPEDHAHDQVDARWGALAQWAPEGEDQAPA